MPEPEADGGGRSRGGKAPRGSFSGWAGSGEVVESCGGESKLGVLYIAAPRRLPRTGFSGEVITAALWLHGRVQRLSVVVGVPWFRLGANRVGIWLLRGSSTERGGAGPSAAGSMLCACRATATVLHACAGEEMATRSHQGVWAAPNGVMPPFCSLSAATVIRPPQDTPAQAGQGATDARKAPSARVRLRTSKPGRELRAKRTVSS